MNPELRSFLRLCLRARHDEAARARLRGEVARQPPKWDEVLRAAKQQRITPLLYTALRHETFVPAEAQQRLRQDYLANAHRNLIYVSEIEGVIADLEAAGVPTIVLKGAALAQTIYQNLAVRPLMDVDLLMRREHLALALPIVTARGFQPDKPETRAGSAAAYENELLLIKHSTLPIALEIHWSLFDSPFYQERLDLDLFWREAVRFQLGHIQALMLDPTSMLLHLCGHLVLHHGGEDLLWEEDILELVRQKGATLDWTRLCERARQFELVIPLLQLLLAPAEKGELEIPAAGLAQLRRLRPSRDEQRIVGYLTAGERSVAQRFWTDLASMGGWRDRAGYAWTHLFPSAEYMRARYGIANPVLVPFYYPYRWLRGIFGWS